MIQRNSTELDQCIARLLPAFDRIFETPSGNVYTLSKLRSKQNEEDGSPSYMLKTIKSIPITNDVKDRQVKLRALPQHENIVPVIAKGYEESKKEVYILSEYFQSALSLEKLIENKVRGITVGQLNSIFYQVVRAMHFLSEREVNHLRLNPSAILVIFPDDPKSMENPVVRICDFGMGPERLQNYGHKFCLHLDYFVEQPNIYGGSFQNKVAYDLWALGSIIYYCLKQKKPFFGKDTSKFFSDDKIFKVKHVRDPNAWLARSENSISQSFLLQRFITRCWGVKNTPRFQSWKQALTFYQQKDYKATEIENTQIRTIFEVHIRTIFLFSKIYILLREELMFKVTKLMQGCDYQSNKSKINKLSLYLFKIAFLFHLEQFKNYFNNRCRTLSVYQQSILEAVGQKLQTEHQFLVSTSIMSKDYTFEKLIRTVQNVVVGFKMSYKELGNCITPQIKLWSDFFQQFNSCAKKMVEIMDHPERNRCQMLFVFYRSEKFASMAHELGFQYTKLGLLSI